jgi:hypothetical protein
MAADPHWDIRFRRGEFWAIDQNTREETCHYVTKDELYTEIRLRLAGWRIVSMGSLHWQVVNVHTGEASGRYTSPAGAWEGVAAWERHKEQVAPKPHTTGQDGR